MEIDIDRVAKNYSEMEDFKLERIAKFEMSTLEPEVKPIIIREIKKRGLDENLLVAIDAQTKELSEEDLLAIINKIQDLDCPHCAKPNQVLVGGILRKVRSYLVFTQFESRPFISCASCLTEERKSHLIKNSLLGWWGIPWGLFYRTPQAIIGHFLDNRIKEVISEGILTEFSIQNMGEIKTNWEKPENIIDFIKHQNTFN